RRPWRDTDDDRLRYRGSRDPRRMRERDIDDRDVRQRRMRESEPDPRGDRYVGSSRRWNIYEDDERAREWRIDEEMRAGREWNIHGDRDIDRMTRDWHEDMRERRRRGGIRQSSGYTDEDMVDR